MDTKNKRGRGRPTVDSDRVCTRIERDVLDPLDTFAADKEANPDAPISRPEAIRRILKDWLESSGYKAV